MVNKNFIFKDFKVKFPVNNFSILWETKIFEIF